MSNVIIHPAFNWTVFSRTVLDCLASFANRFGGSPGLHSIASMDGFSDPDTVDGPSASVAARAKHQMQPEGARILLADDLDLNRRLIADMLSFQGHEVECACDGAAAVRAATLIVFDLVLMDMVMPVMDGLDATRAIRTLSAPHGDVPIVALTANAFPEHLEACLAAGMDATVTKPMSMDALMRAVDTWRRKEATAA